MVHINWDAGRIYLCHWSRWNRDELRAARVAREQPKGDPEKATPERKKPPEGGELKMMVEPIGIEPTTS